MEPFNLHTHHGYKYYSTGGVTESLFLIIIMIYFFWGVQGSKRWGGHTFVWGGGGGRLRGRHRNDCFHITFIVHNHKSKWGGGGNGGTHE